MKSAASACRPTTSEFLNSYASMSRGLDSRSAALHRAIRLLRTADLATAYQAAWEEWDAEDAASGWESTAGDGIAR